MPIVYIVLLLNKALLFSEKKPKKRGNYTQDVRLFKVKGSVTIDDICQWTKNDYDSKVITEVTNWE